MIVERAYDYFCPNATRAVRERIRNHLKHSTVFCNPSYNKYAFNFNHAHCFIDFDVAFEDNITLMALLTEKHFTSTSIDAQLTL